MSRQLSRSAERSARVEARRSRSHFSGPRPVVGSTRGSRAGFRIQHVGAAGYAVRCDSGRTSGGLAFTSTERRTRNDLSRVRRGAIQPANCRADRATTPNFPHSNRQRFGRGDRLGIAAVNQTRSSQGTGNAGVSSTSHCGQSRTTALGTRPCSQFVRLIAAGWATGRDHVSFVGRPFGQARFSR